MMTSLVSPIEVSLDNQNIWKDFYPDTEMIVRRNGRVVFPHLKYNIKGLDPESFYSVFIHMERTDNNKYKYQEGHWFIVGSGDPPISINRKKHSNGDQPGSVWMEQPVSFSCLKITNDPDLEDENKCLVQSMHKHLPVLTIRKVGEIHGQEFRFPMTEFMVVTAYQSQKVIDMKVNHNKYASHLRVGDKRQIPVETENVEPNEENKRKRNASESTFSNASVSPNAYIDYSNHFQPAQFPQHIPLCNHNFMMTHMTLATTFPGIYETCSICESEYNNNFLSNIPIEF